MTPRRIIANEVAAFRKWHYRADPATRDREKLVRQNRILRRRDLSDAERTFVMDECERAPVKEKRGPDANTEVDRQARLAMKYREQHGGTREDAIAKVLSDAPGIAFGPDFGQAVMTRWDNITRNLKRTKGRSPKAKSRVRRFPENLRMEATEAPFPREYERS